MQIFQPAVSVWFEQAFQTPTEVKTQAWPAIREQRHTLIAASTGSGMTRCLSHRDRCPGAGVD
jgi:ATP-dependent Lhr-like helicase